eukprot:6212335-Pleurochrysis_carterae.AAC.3
METRATRPFKSISEKTFEAFEPVSQSNDACFCVELKIPTGKHLCPCSCEHLHQHSCSATRTCMRLRIRTSALPAASISAPAGARRV